MAPTPTDTLDFCGWTSIESRPRRSIVTPDGALAAPGNQVCPPDRMAKIHESLLWVRDETILDTSVESCGVTKHSGCTEDACGEKYDDSDALYPELPGSKTFVAPRRAVRLSHLIPSKVSQRK